MHNLSGQTWVEIGGAFLGWARDDADAHRIIDQLAGGEVPTPIPEPALVDRGRAAFAREGGRGSDWVWTYAKAAERDAVGRWLVATAHPLAYEAGTDEGRFRRLVSAPAGALPVSSFAGLVALVLLFGATVWAAGRRPQLPAVA